ncbi:hypothetical protein DBR43_26875 [Pedobacter sp. KBW06]|uniref:discoidin domain-containing protein n=1 Tax=Pedobacter sp. KBW06 TaxID=2153359 RepID=UPI000F590448|nr:discoidin domain-containing protein [Pedobacter sp. KBW06]RQO65876.1 hypothetical protein DBR43_26875 [Pedobacter sp. KBW06]
MNKISLSAVLLIASLAVLASCKRVSDVSVGENLRAANKFGATGDGPQSGTNNLNVVYFIPSDLDTVPGYQKRLNGVMVYTQNFVSKWMNHWGFTNKTVGIPVDAQGKLRMAVIRGTYPKAQYPYEGGSAQMMTEINAYYAAHPGEKTSDHILVVTPTYSYDTNGYPSGGPFYGIGRWCFALDYTGLDTLNLGKPNDKYSTIWIGGLAHELGHGINLPHNGGAESQNVTFGTTLMGSGNSTFGKSPTYLSPADAAILANCQVFSSTTRSDWYAAPGFQLTKFSAKYQSGNIIVSGKFSAVKAVKDIALYHRIAATDPGGYRSVTFAAKPIGTDSFYVSMPVSDFREKGNTGYEFTIRYCHENGSISSQVINYSFANDIPQINIADKPVYSKTNWSITSYSSQETASESGAATNVIDNSISTYWHSRWSSSATSYPHNLVINMGAAKDVNRFTFWQRDSRRVKSMEILTSNDASTWTSLGTFTLQDTTNPQDIILSTVKNFRYFKLNMKSSYDGTQFAALAEVGTYKD